MTPAEVREAVLSLPLTQQEIAEEIGVSYGHMRNVMSGGRELSKPAQMLLARLVGVYENSEDTEMTRFTAKTPIELIAKIYKAHGWTRVAGESRMKRVTKIYTVMIDHGKGVFIAEKRPESEADDMGA